jgi:hypothetical protein
MVDAAVRHRLVELAEGWQRRIGIRIRQVGDAGPGMRARSRSVE